MYILTNAGEHPRRYFGRHGSWCSTIDEAGPFEHFWFAQENVAIAFAQLQAHLLRYVIVLVVTNGVVGDAVTSDGSREIAALRKRVVELEGRTAADACMMTDYRAEMQRAWDHLGVELRRAPGECNSDAAARTVKALDDAEKRCAAAIAKYDAACTTWADKDQKYRLLFNARPSEFTFTAAERIVCQRDEALQRAMMLAGDLQFEQKVVGELRSDLEAHDRHHERLLEALHEALRCNKDEELTLVAARVRRGLDVALQQRPKPPAGALAFMAADVWQWTDSAVAARSNQRVGWIVLVCETLADAAHVALVGRTALWRLDATEGLKLVERAGKPYTGPQS